MQVMCAWILVMAAATAACAFAHKGIHHRHRILPTRAKRNLVYPPQLGFVQLIAGTGVPVPLDSNQAMTIGWVAKAYFNTPDNASFYTNPYVTVQKRSLLAQQPVTARYDIYKAMELAFQMFGGKDCILRAICETAQVPFRGSSLVSQILHVILTPSSTNEPAMEPMHRIYEGAARMGQDDNADCSAQFPQCKNSLTDIVSMLS